MLRNSSSFNSERPRPLASLSAYRKERESRTKTDPATDGTSASSNTETNGDKTESLRGSHTNLYSSSKYIPLSERSGGLLQSNGDKETSEKPVVSFHYILNNMLFDHVLVMLNTHSKNENLSSVGMVSSSVQLSEKV